MFQGAGMLAKKKSLLFAVVIAASFPLISTIITQGSPWGGKFLADALLPIDENNIFDITRYGISANSEKDAVPAILKACDDARAYVKRSEKRAEIFFPSGTYFIAPLAIENLEKINIHLAENAQIYAFPKEQSQWKSGPFVTITNCSNISLFGEEGAFFDGSGSSWWPKKQTEPRPDFISLNNCRNYEVYGIGINNAQKHTLKLSKCYNGKLHDLSIVSPPDSPNTDGINPMSDVDNLEVYNCFISNGDDGFAINSHYGKINNIYVHDCVLVNGHGFSLGSGLYYDMTNVLVENITVTNAWHGIRIKFGRPERDVGARLDNIKFNNITAKNLTRDAIRITTSYDKKNPNREATLKDISISNFTCVGARRALWIELTDESQAITPLELKNITITDVENKQNIIKYPIVESGTNIF